MAAGLGVGFGQAMSRISGDMRKAIPANFDIVGSAPAAAGPTVYQGPLFTVQNMSVRSEADIESISRQLYRHIQSGARAKGI